MYQIYLKLWKLSVKKFTNCSYYCTSNSSKNLNKNSISHMMTFVRTEKYRLTGAIGLLFISSAVTLSVPLLIGKIIDFISTGKKPDGLILHVLRFFNFKSVEESLKKDFHITNDDTKKFGALTLIFFVIGGLANFGRFYLIQTAGQRIIVNLRNKLYSSLMCKPVEFFDRNQSGELISRITADTTVVGEGLSNNISQGLRSSLQMGMGVTMMLYVSPKLSLLSLFILPPVAGSALLFGRHIKKISSGLQESVALSTEKANESLSAIRTVKAFCKERKEIDNYQISTSNILINAYRDALIRGSFYGLMGMSGNILTVSLLLYGGSLISADLLTVGDLSSFLIYSAYAMISFGGIGTFYTELMKTSGAGSRIWKWLDDENKTMDLLKKPIFPISNQFSFGDIMFKDVTFSYPTRPNQIILNNFSLCIPRGKITAIVGASGCGKSSIVSLLLKFYKISSGKLLIGDKSIDEIDDYVWKHKVAVVLQEPILFSCSIAENIAYGSRSNVDPQLSLSNIERVAEKARVMEFVRNLPNGLDTNIGERGVLISGGQRQRIAIARALISDPDMIIFDEATSALDKENEWLVQQAINEIFQDRTVLTISHRLALLRSANQIAVVSDGKVAELGSFEKLSETSSLDQKENLFKKLLSGIN